MKGKKQPATKRKTQRKREKKGVRAANRPNKREKKMLQNRSTNFIGGKKVIFRDDAEYYNKSLKFVDRPTHSSDVEKFNLLKKVQSGGITFIQSTTIHGMAFLAKRGLHFFER